MARLAVGRATLPPLLHLGGQYGWQIESLFKLLKGAGQQVEHWKQPTGEAIAKRLVVAAMACALVWRLQRAPSAEAATRVLITLPRGPGRRLPRRHRRRVGDLPTQTHQQVRRRRVQVHPEQVRHEAMIAQPIDAQATFQLLVAVLDLPAILPSKME